MPLPRLALDAHSAEPPFEQVRAAVRDAIDAGALSPGERLPSVRALAAELGLAVNTVARSYRFLEQDGFVETRGRGGTIVLGRGDAVADQGMLAARAYADRIRDLGATPDDALSWVRRALAG